MVMARISAVQVRLELRVDQLCGAAGAATGPPISLVRVRVPDSRHGAKVAMMRKITIWYGRRTRTNRFITNRATGIYVTRLDSEKTVATVSTVVSLVCFNEWAHFLRRLSGSTNFTFADECISGRRKGGAGWRAIARGQRKEGRDLF